MNPLFEKIHRIELQTSQLVDALLAGFYRSVFKGQGMEFEEVREYQQGDDIRTIDWNVTARMGHPYIKSFREERELPVLLVVDLSASTRFGTTKESKRELLAEIAAVIAFSAIKNGDRVGLILFSDHVEKYLPPKQGTRHVLRVIRELLTFEASSPATDLTAPLSFAGTVQSKKAICFLLSDFLCALPIKELRLLARRHDLIAVSVADPAESSFPNLGLSLLQDLESGSAALADTASLAELPRRFAERQNQLKATLGRVGADLVSVTTGVDYAPLLRHFFQKRLLRVRR